MHRSAVRFRSPAPMVSAFNYSFGKVAKIIIRRHKQIQQAIITNNFYASYRKTRIL